MNLYHIIKLFVFRFLLLLALFIQPAMAIDFSSGVFKYQMKMAKNGHAKSQYQLGNMYASGRGTKQDSAAAREWYTKAAAQNYQPAKDRLVYMEIVEQGYDKTRHEKWLKQLHVSADNDETESIMLLGSMYKEGFVVKKNLSTARGYYKRGVNQNLPGAETELDSIDAMLASEEKQRLLQKEKTKQAQLKKQQQADQAQKSKQREQARKRKAQQRKAEQARLQAENRRMEQEKQSLAQQRKETEKVSKEADKNRQKEAGSSGKIPYVKPEECDGPWAKHMQACK